MCEIYFWNSKFNVCIKSFDNINNATASINIANTNIEYFMV